MDLLEKPPSFDQLPQAVALVYQKLDRIERLLLKTEVATTASSESLLNIKQASELLTLSVNTIYALVHDEAIPYAKKRRRLYFDKSELIAWVQAGHRKQNL